MQTIYLGDSPSVPTLLDYLQREFTAAELIDILINQSGNGAGSDDSYTLTRPEPEATVIPAADPEVAQAQAQPALIYELWLDATGGSFQLAFNGWHNPYTIFQFDQSASDIERELGNLSPVSAVSVTGSGTEADPWLIAITKYDNYEGAPFLEVQDDSLTGGELHFGPATTAESTTAALEEAYSSDTGHEAGEGDSGGPEGNPDPEAGPVIPQWQLDNLAAFSAFPEIEPYREDLQRLVNADLIPDGGIDAGELAIGTGVQIAEQPTGYHQSSWRLAINDPDNAAGQYRLVFDDPDTPDKEQTAPLSANAGPYAMEVALEALAQIEDATVTVSETRSDWFDISLQATAGHGLELNEWTLQSDAQLDYIGA